MHGPKYNVGIRTPYAVFEKSMRDTIRSLCGVFTRGDATAFPKRCTARYVTQLPGEHIHMYRYLMGLEEDSMFFLKSPCSNNGLVCLLSLLAAIFKTNQPKLVCLIVIVKIIIKTNQQKLVCLIVIVKIIILLLLLLITFFVQEFGKTKQCREHLSTPTVSPMSGKATIRNSTS